MHAVFHYLRTPWNVFVILVLFCLIVLPYPQTAVAATYTVTTNADSGAGSLRQAVIDANANAGTDLIDFAGGLSGETITLLSDLDTISEGLIIDGSALAVPITIAGGRVYFNNTDATNVIKGLSISGSATDCLAVSNTTGLVVGGTDPEDRVAIDDCGNQGIYLIDDDSTTIINTVIGENTGVSADTILADGSTNLIIGGDGANEQNIFVSGQRYGVNLTDVTTATVAGNFIGTLDGTDDAGFVLDGVFIAGLSEDITIGGTIAGDRNTITSSRNGIFVITATTTNVVIEGNYIGTNAAGDTALGNDEDGIVTLGAVTIGGEVEGARNVISGNIQRGITLGAGSDGSFVQGNYVGTNAVGDAAVANALGIAVGSDGNQIGGAVAGARNVLSGNTTEGIHFVSASNNTIQGNYIGTNVAGDAAIPNGGWGGIFMEGINDGNVIGGGGAGEGNLISGNGGVGYGILTWSTDTTNTTIQGNYIGTNADGDAAVPNIATGIGSNSGDLTIGGINPGEGNLISGNANMGIELSQGPASTVQGNIVGLNAVGDTALSNGGRGVYIESSNGNSIGGAVVAARNIISGNLGVGVVVSGGFGNGDENIITSNYIGTNVAGDAAIANGGGGIQIIGGADDNVIGGVGQGNVISGNSFHGIIIDASDRTVVQGNVIGLNAAGDAAIANVGAGIRIAAFSDNNVIGGVLSPMGNILSGNISSGIIINGGDGNMIKNNTIGLNTAGDAAIPNGFYGIDLFGEITNTVIGAAGQGNVISGNTIDGIILGSALIDSTTIQGNTIGANLDGDGMVGNGRHGILLIGSQNTAIGGSGVGDGNLIAGNVAYGINVNGADDSTIKGNIIGLNADGDVAFANGSGGIVVENEASNTVIGGALATERNVVSGNTGNAIYIETLLGSTVQGNYVGVNALGDMAVSNSGWGVVVVNSSAVLIGGEVEGARNVISGNTATGGVYLLGTDDSTVENNTIGLNAAGDAAIANAIGVHVSTGSDANDIGVSGFGNIISGNTGDGLRIEGNTGNSVQANIIGLGADGVTVIGNGSYGVELLSGNNTIGTIADDDAINVISGNVSQGIIILGSDSNTIVHNYVGLAADGATQKLNGSHAIYLDLGSASNVIGGTAVGAGNNLAADDGFACVWLHENAGDFNAIRRNDCPTETAAALHINLEGPIPNEGLDAPVITPETATTSHVGGTSIANGSIDIFVDGLYVASTTANGAGNWDKHMVFAVGGLVSASVTNASSSTSATSSPQVIIILDITDPSAPIIVTPASGGSINIEMVTLTGTKEAYTSIWIGDTEEVVNDELTTWTITDYPIDPGLNTLSVTAEDYSDNASEALIFTITYNPLTMELTIDQQTVEEDSEASIVTIQLSGVYPLDVTIPYVVTGTAVGGGVDYVLADGDFVVADGDTEAIITFTIIDDDDKEDDETIIITLGDPDYGTLADVTVQTITIDHNDRGGSAIYFAPVDDPELAITTPTSGTAVNSGQRLQIRWTTQGPITYVNIQFSDSNGSAWTTVTTVSNSRSSTITVPETSASTAYLRLQGTDLDTVSTTSNQVRLAMNGSVDSGEASAGSGQASGEDTSGDSSGASTFAGSLIKLADDGNAQTQTDSTVYVIGADEKRHVFPNAKAYFTWFSDFDKVEVLSSSAMAERKLGVNVTYRPGAKMIKFQADSRVYAVSRYGILHWVATEDLAKAYYGSDWKTQVDDVSDAFYFNYVIGESIDDVLDYNPEAEQLGIADPVLNFY